MAAQEHFGGLVSGFLVKPQGSNGDGDRFNIIIPRYQRPYKWSPAHAVRMLEDAWSLSKKVGTRDAITSHYMGAIITFFNKEEGAYEIVDGQQRVITFSLLCAAIRYVSSKHTHLFVPPQPAEALADMWKPLPSEMFGFKAAEEEAPWSSRIIIKDESLNNHWCELFSGGEYDWALPSDSAITNEASKYAVNFSALCNQLSHRVEEVPAADRFKHVRALARYVGHYFRATIITAPTKAAARQAFRVANYRGQPFELAEYAKSELHDVLCRNIEQQLALCSAFEDCAPDESELAVLSVTRAWLCRADILDGGATDDLEGIVGELMKGGPASEVDAARFCTRGLQLHSSMLEADKVFRGAVAVPAPFPLRQTLSFLFALEAAGSPPRQQEEEDDGEPDVAHTIWRAAAIKILHVLDINDLVTAKVMKPKHELAREALQGLERVQLLFMRPAIKREAFSEAARCTAMKSRVDSILSRLASYQPLLPLPTLDVFCPELILTPDELKQVTVSVTQGQFYGGHIRLAKAGVRHLLARLNLLYERQLNPATAVPKDQQGE